MRELLLALLLVSPRAAPALHLTVTINAAQSVTLAWDDPAPSTAVGYRVHWGTAAGVYANVADVGLVLTWTTPVLPTGQYFFMVTAYDANGIESGPSNEVADPDVVQLPDDCARLIGAHAVSIFITKMEDTTGNVGSQARLNFQVGAQGSPVTSLAVGVNGAPVDQPVVGTNLNKVGGIWFTTPSTPGTYPVTLTASNGACTTVADKDALSKPLTVTVK